MVIKPEPLILRGLTRHNGNADVHLAILGRLELVTSEGLSQYNSAGEGEGGACVVVPLTRWLHLPFSNACLPAPCLLMLGPLFVPQPEGDCPAPGEN